MSTCFYVLKLVLEHLCSQWGNVKKVKESKWDSCKYISPEIVWCFQLWERKDQERYFFQGLKADWARLLTNLHSAKAPLPSIPPLTKLTRNANTFFLVCRHIMHLTGFSGCLRRTSFWGQVCWIFTFWSAYSQASLSTSPGRFLGQRLWWYSRTHNCEQGR